MAALSDEVKVFVVQGFACYDQPRVIKAAVKERFKVEVSDQQLQAYNPTSHAGQRLGKKLRAIFEATRQKFLDDTSDIPIAQRSYRLRVLDRMAAKLEEKGNVGMVAQLIEQAAKETGDAYTNKQKHEHSGTPMVVVKDYTGRG